MTRNSDKTQLHGAAAGNGRRAAPKHVQSKSETRHREQDGVAYAELPLSEGEWEWLKLRRIASHQLEKCVSLVPVTMFDGDVDAVNKLRITTRRLQQVLDLLYPKHCPGWISHLRRRLRESRHTLGDLRDDDALLALVQASMTFKPALHAEAWSAVKEYLQARRLHDAPKILEEFSRINLISSYGKLKGEWQKPLNGSSSAKLEPGRMKRRSDARADRVVYGITTSLDGRWCEFVSAVRKSRRRPQESTIHQMRIAAKRFRYLAAILDKLRIKGSTETEAWLQTLQQVVGRWHDRELLEHAMYQLLGDPKFGRENPEIRKGLRELIGHNRTVKLGLEHKFSDMTNAALHYKTAEKWVNKTIADSRSAAKARAEHKRAPQRMVSV